MIGTEKQIEWAKKIKGNLIDALEEEKKTKKASVKFSYETFKEIEKFIDSNDSSFFIGNRENLKSPESARLSIDMNEDMILKLREIAKREKKAKIILDNSRLKLYHYDLVMGFCK